MKKEDLVFFKVTVMYLHLYNYESMNNICKFLVSMATILIMDAFFCSDTWLSLIIPILIISS